MEDIRAVVSNDSCCPDLTMKTRFIGFLICCCISFVFGIFASVSLFGVLTGKLTTFIILDSLATGFAISGSFFLKGPKSQWKTITDKKRIIPSIIFFVAFIMTFVAVFAIKSKILAVICVAIQFTAGVFYCLSFIPYGKKLCVSCCKSCFSCEDKETKDSLI